MLVSRIFTVLAAVLLVSAFALIVLPPDGLTLLQGLAPVTGVFPAGANFFRLEIGQQAV